MRLPGENVQTLHILPRFDMEPQIDRPSSEILCGYQSKYTLNPTSRPSNNAASRSGRVSKTAERYVWLNVTPLEYNV